MNNIIVFYWDKFDDNNIASITLILTPTLRNRLFSPRGRDGNLYHLEFHIYITDLCKMALYNQFLGNIKNGIFKMNNHKASWLKQSELFIIIKNHTTLKIEYSRLIIMKPLSRVNYLLLSRINTFSTHLTLEVLIIYHQEVRIDLISTIEYRNIFLTILIIEHWY